MLIQTLLSHEHNKTDINQTDSNGATPFMHAVRTNDVEIVLQLFNQQGKN